MSESEMLLEKRRAYGVGIVSQTRVTLSPEGWLLLDQWVELNGQEQTGRIVGLEPGDIGTLYRALVKRGLIGDYSVGERSEQA